jgi:hypothetical protein
MSPTMFLGRVVLPALGLAVAAGLTWNSVRKITTPTEATRMVESSGATGHLSGRRGESSPTPAPRSRSARKSWA